jgi:hypothetical protein
MILGSFDYSDYKRYDTGGSGYRAARCRSLQSDSVECPEHINRDGTKTDNDVR